MFLECSMVIFFLLSSIFCFQERNLELNVAWPLWLWTGVPSPPRWPIYPYQITVKTSGSILPVHEYNFIVVDCRALDQTAYCKPVPYFHGVACGDLRSVFGNVSRPTPLPLRWIGVRHNAVVSPSQQSVAVGRPGEFSGCILCGSYYHRLSRLDCCMQCLSIVVLLLQYLLFCS